MNKVIDPIVISCIGGSCPTQAEGELKGYPFYFRARHGQWRLDVSPVCKNPVIAEESLVHMEGDDKTFGSMSIGCVMEIIGKAYSSLSKKLYDQSKASTENSSKEFSSLPSCDLLPYESFDGYMENEDSSKTVIQQTTELKKDEAKQSLTEINELRSNVLAWSQQAKEEHNRANAAEAKVDLLLRAQDVLVKIENKISARYQKLENEMNEMRLENDALKATIEAKTMEVEKMRIKWHRVRKACREQGRGLKMHSRINKLQASEALLHYHQREELYLQIQKLKEIIAQYEKK